MSLRASSQGLKIVERARTLKGWNKYGAVWSDQASVSQSTLKRFWRQSPISTETFTAICDAVGIDWYQVAEFEGDIPTESIDYQALLYTSVDRWNQWKKDISRPIIDLENTDLSSADLRKADLRYVSLRAANLRGVVLEEANLSEADLTNADFSGANLTGANLASARA